MAKSLKDIVNEMPKERQEKIQARTDELINQQTVAALKSIEAGNFVEGDRVFEWLDSWGTGNGEEAP